MPLDPDAYFTTGTSSNTSTYNSFHISSDNILTKKEILVEKAPKSKYESYRTEFMKNVFDRIINEFLKSSQTRNKEIRLSVFGKYKSDFTRDMGDFASFKHYYYITYPLPSDPKRDLIQLLSYNLAIIVDVLEYLPTNMARANVVKEALASLIEDYPSYVVILAKSKDEVEEANDEKLITGFDVKDLEALAIFAGATKIWKPKYLKEIKSPCVIASTN